jgi:hypothetical protein
MKFIFARILMTTSQIVVSLNSDFVSSSSNDLNSGGNERKNELKT